MEINPTEVQAIILSSLPIEARWHFDGTTLDFNFSLARDGLRPLPDPTGRDDGNVLGSDLLMFGSQSFANGGGAQPWLCVRKNDGWICGFDPDCDNDAVFVLNSSIQRFIETFGFLNQYLQNNDPLPSGCGDRFAQIDPEANATSDWASFFEHLSDV